MVGRLGDLKGGLRVSDSLVEPAELGEHVGELGSRERRLDAGRPEALVAQVTLECDVPLEEGSRVPERALGSVRHAQKGGRDHLDRAIAEGPRDGQGLLAESDGLVVVASGQALVRHEGGDPPEPVLVAECPGGR
jgi:hypothetical protein